MQHMIITSQYTMLQTFQKPIHTSYLVQKLIINYVREILLIILSIIFLIKRSRSV